MFLSECVVNPMAKSSFSGQEVKALHGQGPWQLCLWSPEQGTGLGHREASRDFIVTTFLFCSLG